MNYQVVDVHLQGHQNYYHLWYLGSAYLDQNSPFSFHEIHLFCFVEPQKNGHYHFPLIFPEFLSVTAIPEQVGKGSSKFPAERTGVCLF